MERISRVKGTRDFYPEEMAFRTWLYQQLKAISNSYGYQEYEGPFLERVELYAAKSGEELVKEQSYVFPDRGGELIALRPELTPTLARMVAERSKALVAPIRWWSFGPFWRYERPQRGRTREFYQWNLDLLGIDSPQADAELVAIVVAFFDRIGLGSEKTRIHINNRRLADLQLNEIGIPRAMRQVVFRLIDRKEKKSHASWIEYGISQGLTQEQLDAVQKMLYDDDAWKRSEELIAFFKAAEALNISEYLIFDPTVIRGLDYYTGTVFEAREATGAERAILGGGRYDNLVSDVGGDPIPGVGFAMGDVVLQLVLETHGLIPALRPNPSDLLMITFDEDLLYRTLEVATKMRAAGISVEWYPEPARIPKQFKYADRHGIPLAAIMGPDEAEQNLITIKDLRTREQKTMPIEDAISYVQSLR